MDYLSYKPLDNMEATIDGPSSEDAKIFIAKLQQEVIELRNSNKLFFL